MKRIILAALAAASFANVAWAADTASTDALSAGFVQPPPSARPWVYWFPLSGNLTKEGITADLEALKRVGIGGVLYMEVDQGAPKGPADFAGPLWRELFQHACKEAHRLGLQINMNNDAGWCGSGGPWITPELSMQKITWSETRVEGGRRFEGLLPQPPAVKGHNTLNPITFAPEALPLAKTDKPYYADIAVLAVPQPAGDDAYAAPVAPKAKKGRGKAAAATPAQHGYRIDAIQGKASFVPQHFPSQPATFATLPANVVIPRDRIIELTDKVQKDGRIAWDVPEGKWIIMRFGHTTTGKDNHPAPVSGRGLECDKLSKAAAEVHFNGLMGRLIADNRPLAGQGKVLVSTHIDSWEVGSQNWTPLMREEFQKRRGYDILPFLPVFTGRVVDSLEVSERFLWDLRQTVSDMLVENYAGHFRTLANRHGLRLSIEAYDGVPADEMTYAGQADEPMAEFWSWVKFGAAYSCTEMSSAAHVYGKQILGAESFTANNGEKWLGHPAYIKDLGDWAFCEGINRFVFHRYAMQPWVNPERAPGMSMGPWGLHYERTETWWEQSKAWHEYLARCQYLLQQGQFVADVCYLQPEGAPRRFAPPPTAFSGPNIRGGYNFDGCTPEVVLTRMSVKDGRIVLPDGMSYRVLVLPRVETMTPVLLAKIKELVQAGATVVAPSCPQKAPGLTNYPACDEEVKRLAADLWGGAAAPKEMTERQVGKGRILWGGALSPEPALAPGKLPNLGSAHWIWYPEGKPAQSAPPGNRYFRRTVTLPAESRVASARFAMTADNEFVCFVNGQRIGTGNDFRLAYTMDAAAALRPGKNLIAVVATNTTDQPTPAGLIGRLTIELQGGGTVVVNTDPSWKSSRRATRDWNSDGKAEEGWPAAMQLGPLGIGPWGQPGAATPAEEVFPPATAVAQWLAKDGLPPDFSASRPLRYIHRRIGEADVYFVANGAQEECQADCAFRVAGKQPELWHPETGRSMPLLHHGQANGCTHVWLQLGPTESVFIVFRRPADPGANIVSLSSPNEDGGSRAAEDTGLLEMRNEVIRPGRYSLRMADGRSREIDATGLAKPLSISGPWQVVFDPKWGGPAKVTFEKLDDWSKRPEEGIKYYSGTASYRTTFSVSPEAMKQPHSRWYIELGKVAVMADVRVNGQECGIAWKTPYRVDVTKAVKAGENVLEAKVVNLWINRQIGDENLPEDCDRNPNGTLKSWPTWIEEGKPSPTGRYTFTSWKLWKKGDPLQESGLLGPVTLREAVRIEP